MKRNLKKLLSAVLIAATTLVCTAGLTGCGSGGISGTFKLSMSQNMDNEQYDADYDNGINDYLYAGLLLGTQCSQTDVTLEIKDGKTYKLTKEAYMIDHKEDGFNFTLTFAGNCTVNEDGTVTLDVPTSGTRYWYCSDMFMEYLDQFAAEFQAIVYPTKTTANEGWTKDENGNFVTVTSETDDTINYWFNTCYLNYCLDENGKLVEAAAQTVTIDKKAGILNKYGEMPSMAATESPVESETTSESEAVNVPVESDTSPEEEAAEAIKDAGTLVFGTDGKLTGSCGIFPVDTTYSYNDGTLTIDDPTFVVTAGESISIVYDFSVENNGETYAANCEFVAVPSVFESGSLVVVTAVDGSVSEDPGALVFGTDGTLTGTCSMFPVETTYSYSDGTLTIDDPTFVVTYGEGTATIVYDFETENNGQTYAAYCTFTVSTAVFE